MRRMLLGLALLAGLGAMPGLVPSAEAAPAFCRSGAGHPVFGRRWCIEKGFGLGGAAGPYAYYDRPLVPPYVKRGSPRYSAWEIVRRDPHCLARYRRFAERHRNVEKRRRFVAQLAREGCGRSRAYARWW